MSFLLRFFEEFYTVSIKHIGIEGGTAIVKNSKDHIKIWKAVNSDSEKYKKYII